MKPVRFTIVPAAADDDIVAKTQTPGAAGNLTLNGDGVTGSPARAVLDIPRRLLFTFAGDEHSRTFVVYGYADTVGQANPVQETITGTTPGTVISTLDFGQVTRISIDDAAAGAIKVGTVASTTSASSPWQVVDPYLTPFSLAINVDTLGTVNYTVEGTLDDVMGGYVNGNWVAPTLPPTTINVLQAAGASDTLTTVTSPITAWRVKINSYTATTGGVRVQAIQAGLT